MTIQINTGSGRGAADRGWVVPEFIFFVYLTSKMGSNTDHAVLCLLSNTVSSQNRTQCGEGGCDFGRSCTLYLRSNDDDDERRRAILRLGAFFGSAAAAEAAAATAVRSAIDAEEARRRSFLRRGGGATCESRGGPSGSPSLGRMATDRLSPVGEPSIPDPLPKRVRLGVKSPVTAPGLHAPASGLPG